MSALWAVYVPGPDEYLAMPSEHAARGFAARHNAAMARKSEFARMTGALGLGAEQLAVVACHWPFDATGHAAELAASAIDLQILLGEGEV